MAARAYSPSAAVPAAFRRSTPWPAWRPGGAPWLDSLFDADDPQVRRRSRPRRGVLLAGADGLGTRAGPRQVVLSLFCRNAPVPPAVAGSLQTVPFNSEPVDLDADGDFDVRSKLTNADGATPPLDCGDTVDNRPVLLIRTMAGTPAAPGVWFAAGLLADEGARHGGGGSGRDY